MDKMEIVKRNGTKMEFNPSKILTRIKKQAEGLKVNPDELFIKVTQGIGDGITTKQIDDLIAITSDSLSHKHPDYSKLAANIFISRLHKETEENYLKLIKRLKNSGIANESLYLKVKENFDVIQKAIDYSRDYNFDYFACSRLKEIYLLKERDEIVERPQHMYMRIALTVTETIEDAITYYNLVSTHKISPATPISINAGTTDQSMISCNLTMGKGDNTPDLLKTLANISISSSRAEGIGLALHNIRSKESYVGKGGGKAGGLLKYMKVVNESLRFWNQKGKRPGAAAVYLEPWHKDVSDLIEIRKEGADELRARDMFAALWIPDNFMRAVESDGDWWLFCPNDLAKNGIKPFWEIYGEEYEAEYNKAVALGIGNKIKAQSLWKKILEAQIETGVPYMAYKDHVNRKSNQQNIGTIKSSNLCCEINLYSDADTTAQCVLSSLVLQKFVEDGQYNFKALHDATYEVVKSLNVLIDVNDFSTAEARKGAEEQRALAIGVQGLADTFAMMGHSFTSNEAKLLNKQIFETIYYASLKSSCDWAKLKGETYKFFEGSPFSQGVLQWDMWDLKEDDLSGLWDWKSLKEDIKKFGVKNSTLTSTMPTASSASVIGSTEAIEPFFSNMYIRKVIGGEHIVINKYLVEDLESMGLWNESVKADIIKFDGSVQELGYIPMNIRDKYKTVYEISQKDLINMSADRAPFIDQSQSLNIFMKNPTVGKLTSSHFHGWRLGLKTGQYYLRTDAIGMSRKQLAMEVKVEEEVPKKPDGSPFECYGCSA